MATLKPNELLATLSSLIDELNTNKALYTRTPSDHSRNRKLSFSTVIKTILKMSGGSINHELLKLFHNLEDTPTSSAFVQQRSKINSKAFEALFHSFINKTNPQKTYKGYRLLAIDGSDLHIPTNKSDTDSYFAKINEQRPYNLLHLNCFFDICSKTYEDAIIQKSRLSNENSALIEMVDRNPIFDSTIVIADRGYESYNAMAHIQEKGWNYLFRIKDPSSRGGIANGLELPNDSEFDFFIDLRLSAGRTQEHWELYKNKNNFKRISHPEDFDFFITEDGSRDIYKFYHLPFRIIRIKLEDGIYETIMTNLPQDTFPSSEIKRLYSMRWGIETSFRNLKYALGLLYFHARKTDLIYQEIYAHLIMYNFVSLVIQSQEIQKKTCKHKYKSSFSMAIHICRDFINKKLTQEQVLIALTKYLTPIRQGRKSIRRKKKDRSVMSFNYRLS